MLSYFILSLGENRAKEQGDGNPDSSISEKY